MVCWIDIVPFKIKDRKGRVCQHAMVCVMGMERSGSKSLMGLYPSAATLRKVGFWKQVLKNLQKRGLNDVLVWYVDESEKLLQNVLNHSILWLLLKYKMSLITMLVHWKID